MRARFGVVFCLTWFMLYGMYFMNFTFDICSASVTALPFTVSNYISLLYNDTHLFSEETLHNMPMKVRFGPWGVFCEFLVWSVVMTSSNGNIFRITGPLCREFTWRSFVLIHSGAHFQVWLLMNVTSWKELSVRASSRYWWRHLPCPPVLICQHVAS